MSVMAQGASTADAARSSLADLVMLAVEAPDFVGKQPKFTGAAVVYLIDDFCIYARCSRKALPEPMKLMYTIASDNPQDVFDRQLVVDRMKQAA